MSDIDIFHKLIKESAKIPVVDHYKKKKVILKEPQHSESKATIYGLPEKVIVIKADAFKSPDAVFSGCMGECKRADFVIAAEMNNKKVILCIEMKSEIIKNNTIIEQLKGAHCFILYCREIVRKFRNEKNFLEGYEYRFISIVRTGIPKKKTRFVRESGVHDTPEKMLKISSPHHLQFNLLAGA
jgi:hypothetical protein